MEPLEPAAIDARELRLGQGAIAVLVLSAFVFGLPILVAAAAVVSALGAVVGPHANPVHAAFRSLAAPRLGPPRMWESPAAVRALDACATVLCGVATLAFAGGIDLIGWLLALVSAAIAVVAATTGVNAAVALRDRFRRD